ncbi:MAG TPA: MATE family efflux transporter [Candidatus Obscuribacterales bacterium]
MRLLKRHLTVGEMTVPLIACSMLNAFVGLADTWIAGSISPGAQAAVAIGEQFLYIAICMVSGLTIGLSTVVSQALGARKISLARAYAADGMMLAAVFGLAGAIVGILLPNQLYAFLQIPTNVAQVGSRYLFICSFGNLPFSLLLMVCALLRSFGRPLVALMITALCSIISVTGAFYFTHGEHNIGIDALGLSWLVGSTAAVILGLAFVHRALKRPSRLIVVDALQERLSALLKLALPPAFSEIIYGVATILFFREVLQASGGLAAQAGYAACQKIEETFATMPMQAVSQSVACVVGRMFGAANFAAANETGKRATVWSGAAMILVGALIALISPAFAHSFSASADTQGAIGTILCFAPLLYAGLGVSTAAGGALDGAGRCARVAFVYSGSAALVRLPVAVLLLLCGVDALTLVVTAVLLPRCVASLILVNDLRIGLGGSGKPAEKVIASGLTPAGT